MPAAIPELAVSGYPSRLSRTHEQEIGSEWGLAITAHLTSEACYMPLSHAHQLLLLHASSPFALLTLHGVDAL